MLRRPRQRKCTAENAELIVHRLHGLFAGEYRALIDLVGRPWHWVEVARMDDEAIARRLAEPSRSFHAAYRRRRFIGYFELAPTPPDEIEIIYLGVVQEETGRGVGRWLLDQAIENAWAAHPKRVLTRTCTLDHPAALPLYLRAGFRIEGHQNHRVDPLNDAEILWLDRQRHLPLGKELTVSDKRAKNSLTI